MTPEQMAQMVKDLIDNPAALTRMLANMATEAMEMRDEIGRQSELIEAYEGGLQEIANLAPDNGNTEIAAARLNRAVSIALTTLDCRSLQTKDTK